MGQKKSICRHARSNATAVWTLLSGVFAASLLLPLPAPVTGQIGHLPSVCLFYHVTGLPCPGCGLTRSFVSLGHGHLRDALHWHPLGPIIFLLFLIIWLRCGVFLLRGVTLLPLPPRAQQIASQRFTACLAVLLTGIIRIGWLSAHHLRF